MRTTLALMSLFLLTSAAESKVLTRCGGSNGYAYFFQGPLVPKDKAGWQSDGIAGGSIQLIMAGDDFDIVYTDTMGSKSYRAEGFNVRLVQAKGDLATLLLTHDGTRVIEYYTFQLDSNGHGIVIWGTIRAESAIAKNSIYHSICKPP